MNLTYSDELIGDLTTEFNLFAQVTSGQPFSYTFNTDRNNALFGRSGDGESPFDNDNLFVPTFLNGQISDPRVVASSGFDQAAFADFIQDQNIRTGRILDTNSDQSTWNRRFDFRFAQEIPFFNSQVEKFVGENSLKFVVDIFNVANLLDSDWGKQRSGPGFDAFNIVTSDLVTTADVFANGVDAATALTGDAARTACVQQNDCVYRFNRFNEPRTLSFDNDISSLYQIRVGVRYTF